MFAANAWGLYNVHGNVWDWTEDCWNSSNTGNPGTGAERTTGDCKFRVVRGGTWVDYPRHLRSAVRIRLISDVRGDGLGFRVSRSVVVSSQD